MKKWVIIPLIVILIAGCGTTGYALAQQTEKLNIANSEIESMSVTIVDLEATVSSLRRTVTILKGDKAVLQEERDTLESDLEQVNSVLTSTKSRVNTLESDLRIVESDLRTVESELRTVRSSYEVVKRDLEELQTFYDGIFRGEPPPYFKPGQEPLHLIDIENASDPTWSELVEFLRNDQTDRQRYIVDEYVCSGFAEDLHNNAEAAGIRCAFVFLGFEESPVGHVMNAFNTTDRGLVFIDCTGSTSLVIGSMDRIAYIRIGERYGLLRLDENIESFEYNQYEEFCRQLEQRIASYSSRVAAHNADIQAYNIAVQAHIANVQEFNEAYEAYQQNPTLDEYLRLVAWSAEIDAEYQRLTTWLGQINARIQSLNAEMVSLGFQRDSLGGILDIVTEVEMYW